MKLQGKCFTLLAATIVGTSSAANRMHDRIHKLPEPKRNEILTEFMSRSGEPCEVTRSFFQGFDERKAASWNLACSNNKAYSIMLNDDGSNSITDCKRLKALSNIDCFKAFQVQ